MSLTALACFGAQAAQVAADNPDPRIRQLISMISEQRLREIDEKLVSFGTRNTLSDATSTTRGIGAARQWIFDEMQRSSPRLRVSFDSYMLAPQERILRQVELRNVIAVLRGQVRAPTSDHNRPPTPGLRRCSTTILWAIRAAATATGKTMPCVFSRPVQQIRCRALWHDISNAWLQFTCRLNASIRWRALTASVVAETRNPS
ncbi:MAG: hypothetical protein ABI616_15310 [Pseudomonadota bacterium]